MSRNPQTDAPPAHANVGELTPERQRIIIDRTRQLRAAQRAHAIAQANYGEAKKARDKAADSVSFKAGQLYEAIDGEVQTDLPFDPKTDQ